MLTVNHLTIKDRSFDYELVKDLSFSLQPGDKIAVIGSEGTGKSTLFKIISNQQVDYVESIGDIFASCKIVYTEQNILYRWKSKTAYQFLFENEEIIFDYQISEARKHLMAFGFEYNQMIDRPIDTFSGGEKVKLSLVKAFLQSPDILLLDEPSNDLDFETIVFLESFLINTEIPLMFISHDQRLLENVANGIIHLQHIHKQKRALSFFSRVTYQDYKQRYFNKYQSDLSIARKQRSDYERKMKKFRQIYSKVEHQQNQAVRNPSVARLLKKKIHALKSQEKRFLKEKESWKDIPEKEEPMHIFFNQDYRINPSKRMIEFKTQAFELLNHKIIKSIDLQLKGDEKVVIYGKNGIGKTTLIRKIVDALKENHIKYGFLPQNYMDVLNLELTVVSYLLNHQEKYVEYQVRQILGQLGFKRQEMDEQIKNISEGQKLKVLLLLLVSKDTEILVLDEPTRNISPINQDEIYDLFLNYSGAILSVTHDRSFIEAVFDKIYELTENGLELM